MESSAEIVWTVNNFFSVKTNGLWITSKEFVVGKENPTKWKLLMYPCGYDEAANGFVSLYLWCLDKVELGLIVNFSLSIFDKEGNIEMKHGKVTNPDHMHLTCGFRKFIKNERLNETNVPVIVKCSMKVKGSKKHKEKTLNSPKDLKLNLWEMRDNNLGTDVVVKVGADDIPCHKVVLAARSKVFKAILMNDGTVEGQTNLIPTEYTYECMEKLIEYVYLGPEKFDVTDGGIKNLVVELFSAADYYDVQGLKKWCEMVLIENITVDNVFTTLQVAWKASCKELIHECIKFFQSNAKDISVKEFENMFAKDSVLAAHLFHQAVSQEEVRTAPLNEICFREMIWQCFLNEELTDLTVKCSGGVILCHKVILMANSPILKGIILSLNENNEITINGYSRECLLEMIQYMYTGKLEEVYDIAVELIKAAHEYQLVNLKNECEQILFEMLDEGILECAWECKCLGLRDEVVDYLLDNPEFLDSTKYATKSPEFVVFVTEKLVERMSVLKKGPVKIIVL